MFKKLVRYGNSHALVFDKALLELLDINPETSKLKISTDGKSIFITPAVEQHDTQELNVSQGEIESHYASEVFNKTSKHLKSEFTQEDYQALQAEKDALRNEFIKKYNVDMETIFEKEFSNNPNFCKEHEQINRKARERNFNPQEYAKALNALIKKYSPFPGFEDIRAEYGQRMTEIGKKYFEKKPNA